MKACKLNYKNIVEILIERSANIFIQDQLGETCLSHSVREGNIHIVLLLLNKRALVD